MKNVLEAGSPMGFFNALLDIGKDAASVLKKFKAKEVDPVKYMGGSISNYAKELTMSFPMLCDNSINPETASKVSRANERHIVTLFELLFASANFNANSGVEVIKSIHQNMKTNYDFDDYFDTVQNFRANLDETYSPAALREATDKMIAELKQKKHSFPANSFSESSMNNYSFINQDGKVSITEAKNNPKGAYDSRPTITGFKFVPGNPDLGLPPAYVPEEDVDRYKDNYSINWDQNYKRAQFYNDLYFKTANAELQQKKFEKDYEKDPDAERAAKELEKIKMSNMRAQTANLSRERIRQQLVDTDVKKSNEMAPTLMIVTYNTFNPDNHEFISEKSFAAGVKSRLIPVDPYDIIDHIVAKNKTKVSFLNLIRATTGEIKFMKDFLLCIDQAKIDAKNGIKKGESAGMWKTLEALAIKNNYNRIKRSGNDASAITTLVINQETVNALKKQYDFDIEKMKNAKMILDAYNLLGIIIVDESIEVVKFLYRGQDRYEQQAFDFIEKEDRDKSYKKIINLMGQAGRF